MVWHIFKKDWKLLWVFVLAAASLHWIGSFIVFKLGMFGEETSLSMLSFWIPELAIFGSMFLIAAIVHLEAIPGTRQDWLTRPVPRGILLLEKFLFGLIAVEGPIFISSVFQGLANGFSWRSSLLAALSRVVFLLFFLVLPIFAFASITRNMTEAFIMGCGCTFILGAFLILAGSVNTWMHNTLLGVTHTGIGWIGEVFRFFLVAIAATIILGLQYYRRKTTAARLWLIGFGLLLLASTFLPWEPAFAIEERLSPNRGAGKSTQLAFEPSEEKFKSPFGLLASAESDKRRESREAAEVYLPLRIAGTGNDSILLVDRADVHLIDRSRGSYYHGLGDTFSLAREGSNPQEESLYQQIDIPAPIFRKVADESSKIRIDYSLTLFGLNKSYSLAALDGDERMPGWGWCKTALNESGTAVEVRCMEPGKGPICASIFLENSLSGARDPAVSACLSEYRLFGDRPMSDNVARFGVNLPFRDKSGLTKFPVDGSQLPHSRVVIRMYEPEDHFTRSLDIPGIKLKDWQAQ